VGELVAYGIAEASKPGRGLGHQARQCAGRHRRAQHVGEQLGGPVDG
jgi:hypothetical protein